MDYRVKRLFGTLFVTALVILVWALVTGTAHAQTRASIFTTAQLFQGVPVAQRECLNGKESSCEVVRSITNELIDRGALQAASTPTIDKLRVLVSFSAACMRSGACAQDAAIMGDAFATMLIANRITPDEYLHAIDTHYGELWALGPTFCTVLLNTYANVQRDRANGL